jgi:dTDP-4-dehydrorhamnose reductase
MKKLLLTGAGGFLGYNFLQLQLSHWQVYAITHQRIVSHKDIQKVDCDLTDFASVKNVFRQIKPDAVLHFAALSNADFCENNPGLSHRINVESTNLIAGLCAEVNISFLFTSTDLVFDGTKGNYEENVSVNPVSLYGRQKAEAEKNIMEIYAEACILRLPLMFGYGGQYAQSFMQPILKKLEMGESLNLFTDEYRSIVGGRSAAQGILLALENIWKGIFHLGGKEKISRYDFGIMMCEVFGLNQSLIIPTLQKVIKLPAPRPPDVSLNSEKAYQKGYAPLPVYEELKWVAAFASPY